jgi:hypothetical protein
METNSTQYIKTKIPHPAETGHGTAPKVLPVPDGKYNPPHQGLITFIL